LETGLDTIDRKLLNCLQAQFPIDREPFSVLGRTLDTSEQDIIHRIEGLKSKGIVRLISPVFNARSLGYQITLVAAQVAENRLDAAAQVISEHPGVGHCYRRDHRYNLWSTLALPAAADMGSELQSLREQIEAEVVFELPMLKTFKIVTYFDAGGEGCPGPVAAAGSSPGVQGDSGLSPLDRTLINELQKDLPLVTRPFDIISERLGLKIDAFLDRCRALLQRGIMRRFGASISHQSIGYVANAMVCWIAAPDTVQQTGETLAKIPAVSHCYERRVNSLWPYNLFCMIHARNRDTCYSIADKMSRETGLKDYVLLFSTKEYKKVRIVYHV